MIETIICTFSHEGTFISRTNFFFLIENQFYFVFDFHFDYLFSFAADGEKKFMRMLRHDVNNDSETINNFIFCMPYDENRVHVFSFCFVVVRMHLRCSRNDYYQ